MKHADLVARLAARHPQCSLKDVDRAVKLLLEAISDALAQGKRIEIRGFGSFSLKRHAPRIGRNPKTGERVQVPEKFAPYFKPGKVLRERVKHCAEPASPAGEQVSGSQG